MRRPVILTAAAPHWAFLLVLAGAATLSLTAIGSYRQFLRAEAPFALGARMMLETGNWLLPHSPQELPLTRPPLTYWLIGLGYELLGVAHGSSRIVSALCALGVLTAVYILAVRTFDRHVGVLAAAILATSYLFWSFSRLAMPDMLLTLCLTVTMVSWSLVLVDRTSRPQRTLFVGYVAMAFGVLSKGPVAIVLPAMAVLLHTAWTRRLDSVRRLRPMLGGLVVLGIVSPYFIRVAVSAGTGPIENFFLHENIRRFTGTAFSTSTVPFVYEMSALLGDFFPWTPAVVLAAWAWLGYRQVPEAHRRAAALLAVWILAPLVFFIVSRFKLDYYFLPAMPPAAVLTAYALTSPALLTRGVRRVAVVTAGAIMVLAVLTGIAAGKMIEVNFAETAGRWVPHVVASLGAIAATALAWRYGIRAAALGFAGTIWATTVSGYLVLLEDYSRFHASAQVARLFRPDTTVLISERASPWGSDLALYAPGATGMRELLQPAPLGTVTREGAREPAVMAVIDDRDYADIAQQAGMPPRILAEWPAYRANKLTLKSLLHPAYGRLYVIGVPAHRAREPVPGVRAEPG